MRKHSARIKASLLVRDDDHVAGPETAAITVVAYCDFECPFCGRAYSVINRLRSSLNDRLRFVFRHFPLSKHPHARQAAEAAEAAGAQGRFWAMHELLFENQKALSDEDLYAYAKFIGLDSERFEQALRSRRYAMRVERDIESGRNNGVRGTPTFFVNGSRHTDEDTLERLVLGIRHRIRA